MLNQKTVCGERKKKKKVISIEPHNIKGAFSLLSTAVKATRKRGDTSVSGGIAISQWQ